MRETVVESNEHFGTHTLPKFAPDEKQRVKANAFWASGKPSILADPAFRARREAKKARHAQNKAARAEDNRRRYSKQGK